MPKQGFFLVAIFSFILISFILYWAVDSSAKRRQDFYGSAERQDGSVQKLIQKVDSLKQQVSTNEELVKQLNNKLDKVQQSKDFGERRSNEVDEQKGVVVPPLKESAQKRRMEDQEKAKRYKGNKVEVVFDLHNRMRTVGILKKIEPDGKHMCPAKNLPNAAKSDVQMLNVYDILPFDNPDGGVWKQGYEIEYDRQKIQEEKRLEVVVIPHSHNDPGWLRTFEQYYEEQTKLILDKMVKHLTEKPEMKFIYAEMSFFELWWSKLSDDVKEKVKGLTKNGQLELVTGGWVMTDEANSHYFSIIMEMIEGHEFLSNQIGIKPKSHWAIDPFGFSPTLAYLLNRSNLTHMAIQRVHYSVKKHLAKQKALEFQWRQLFAGDSSSSDITAHMFPFFSYDVPHTCGPDPKVCCQFDFRRLHTFFCPWGKPPLKITSENVAERAEMLMDQYWKKAQLYRENTLLVPLGDDFRYDTDSEWNDQYKNYRLLMDYMNKKKEWNINVRFGTLIDYFNLLERRLAEEKEEESKLPVLSGDFFTYADRDDHYWSGYFTSRPFFKHLDRTLQHYLRSADILFSLAHSQSGRVETGGRQFSATSPQLFDQLVEARRALSLFQHHDGVTGTAKRLVVIDYGEKMLAAIKSCKSVISAASEYLMKFPPSREEGLRIDEEHSIDQLPEKVVIEDGSSILVFNSLAQPRQEVVCVQVSSWKSRVSGAESEEHRDEVPQQIGPVIYVTSSGTLASYKDKFELCFLAKLPALGFTRYDIFEADDTSHKVKIRTLDNGFSSEYFEVKEVDQEAEVSIANANLKAAFDSKTGYLKSVANKAGSQGENEEDVFQVQMSFVHYGARPHNTSRNGDSLSGAYLFLPDGPARQLAEDGNSYVIVEGSVRQYVFVRGPNNFGIRQSITLDVNAQSLAIKNQINMATGDKSDKEQILENNEVAMRVNIPSLLEDKFYTDLNGFQMIRRRRFSKLPLQAQFYPMSGAIFLEDSKVRLSLLGRQALGAASLEQGMMEVMLDRRLVSDDDRGMGEGVLDNRVTESHFRLFLEPMKPKSEDTEGTIGYHSLPAHHTSLAIHYPPMVLVGQVDHASSAEVLASYSALPPNLQFPCDLHLVALRTASQPTIYGEGASLGSRSTAPDQSAGLIIHRLGVDCSTKSSLQLDCRNTMGKVQMRDALQGVARSIWSTSLTLLHPTQDQVEAVELEPMEIRTLKLEF